MWKNTRKFRAFDEALIELSMYTIQNYSIMEATGTQSKLITYFHLATSQEMFVIRI